MSNQRTRVSLSDSKTSKLEAGIILSVIVTVVVLVAWVLLLAASVVNISWIDSVKAESFANVLTPIIVTTLLLSLVTWLLGKYKPPG